MNDDWLPFDEEHSKEQIATLIALLRTRGMRTVLDLGCGDGRLTIPLAQASFDVTAVDHDPIAVAACEERLKNNGLIGHVAQADFFDFDEHTTAPFDCAVCLGNTFMTVTSFEQMNNLFKVVSRNLNDGGCFLVDDFPFEYWRDIAEGNWREGISEDGAWQIVWQSGQPVFAIRRGADVNSDCWHITDEDRLTRLRRLWSLDELAWLARPYGLKPPTHEAAGHLLIFNVVR